MTKEALEEEPRKTLSEVTEAFTQRCRQVEDSVPYDRMLVTYSQNAAETVAKTLMKSLGVGAKGGHRFARMAEQLESAELPDPTTHDLRHEFARTSGG